MQTEKTSKAGILQRHTTKKIKNICPQKNLDMNVQSNIIDYSYKERCPSSSEWVKCDNINIMGYYLVIKRNEVLIQAATWMDLKNMLNVGSLTQKKYIDQIKQIHKDRK